MDLAERPGPGHIGSLGLLLADARLPSGAHAHSGGTEQAVDEEIVRDLASLEDFLLGRLATTIALEAHVAAHAAACASELELVLLDAEVDARMVAPSARAASRRQGAQLWRTACKVFGAGALDPATGSGGLGPHLCLAAGAVAAIAGLAPQAAATVVAYQAVTSGASAALRLLGLDPIAVAALVASLCGEVDALARAAAIGVADGPGGLPGRAAPVLDRLVEMHAAREERLFAS